MSKIPMTAKEIAQIIGSAFAPLRCVAEDWDYGNRIRFRIFNNADEALITQADLLWRELSDETRLKFEIEYYRAEISKLGYRLDPWVLS
jgi:hypothetical protein